MTHCYFCAPSCVREFCGRNGVITLVVVAEREPKKKKKSNTEKADECAKNVSVVGFLGSKLNCSTLYFFIYNLLGLSQNRNHSLTQMQMTILFAVSDNRDSVFFYNADTVVFLVSQTNVFHNNIYLFINRKKIEYARARKHIHFELSPQRDWNEWIESLKCWNHQFVIIYQFWFRPINIFNEGNEMMWSIFDRFYSV